jgi:hypothetical protein
MLHRWLFLFKLLTAGSMKRQSSGIWRRVSSLSTFRSNVLPLSSESKGKPSKNRLCLVKILHHCEFFMALNWEIFLFGDRMILRFLDMTVLKDIRGDVSKRARYYLLFLLQEHVAFHSVSSLIVRCSKFAHHSIYCRFRANIFSKNALTSLLRSGHDVWGWPCESGMPYREVSDNWLIR